MVHSTLNREDSISTIADPLPGRPSSTSLTSGVGFSYSTILPQYLASLACAGGGFAIGTIMGWAAPASSKRYTPSTYHDLPEDSDHSCANETLPADRLLVQIQASIFSHETFLLTPNQFSWAVTIPALSAALSAIPTGLLVKSMGRKVTLFAFLLPLVIGWMVVMFATNFLSLFTGRLLLGISCGANSVVVPIYSAEVAIPAIRGRVGVLFDTMCNVGMLFMFCLGPFVDLPTLVFISANCTLLFYAFFYFAPESPTFLVSEQTNEREQCQPLSPLD